MSWGSSWDDKKPDNGGWPVIENAQPAKPFGQVLKEHNEAAEASMKPVKASLAIGIDWGSEDKTAVAITQADNIIYSSEAKELKIPDGWNNITLTCIPINDLAVILNGDPEDHCIVHIPTLKFFDNAIPEYIGDGQGYTIEQLCLWAWKVQLTDRIYFKEMAKYDNSNYKDIDKAMLSNLQQYCLSIKVE